jgi:cytokinin riboside 5'-monophosphate phosphoribohydrolase
MRVCVFCASSERADDAQRDLAAQVGRSIAERGHRLVHGGTRQGLMAVVAAAASGAGAHVTGIVPAAMRAQADPVCDELVVTDSLAARKTVMVERSDAFLVLPGGLGTLDELLEVVTLRQLGVHDRPIALLGTDGFWAPLVAFLEDLGARGLAAAPSDYLVATEDPAAALDHLEGRER